jgi:D-lyxose ketol-isomerase
MNKDRQRRLEAKKQFKQPVTNFQQIDLGLATFIPKGMTRAFKNTRYVVMVYDNSPVTTGTAIRVMVQKHNDTPILNHWSEMQKIKNEIFGEETIAVEYYPAKSQLIDDHNIYWFWIFPENVLPIPLT